VVADALDPDAVARAVAETEPEVIVHQLTALKGEPGLREMRNPDRFAAMTNRLRTEGTDHLLAAGRAVGIRRFIAQSVVAIGTYARTGGPVKTEDDPLDLDLPAKGRSGADAVRSLEDAVTGIEGAEGLVLRYGAFYGPGTGLSADPEALLTKGDPQAAVPDHRRRRRCLVVRAHQGRGQRHGGGRRQRRARHLQRRRRRAGTGA
jgi:nucleoside-diphosphate-sugar epimerase